MQGGRLTRATLLSVFVSGLALAGLHNTARGFPTKPIRIVVPFAPGGGTDTLTRILAQKLTESVGQSVVVDNRPGATGIIGTDIVAKASPDGYTVLMTISSHIINPSLHKSLPFDAIKDFAPVMLVNIAPRVLVVHPSVPARTFKDFVAYATANPGKLNYASGGSGTATHLAGELLNVLVGIKTVHIPFKGGGPLLIALLANEVQMTYGSPSTIIPHIKGGRLVALGMTSAKRVAVMPDLPTLQEQGVAGYEAVEWNAVLAPAGTPAGVVSRLNAELQRVLDRADVRETLVAQGNQAVGGTPQQCASYLRSEFDKYAKIVRAAAIRID